MYLGNRMVMIMLVMCMELRMAIPLPLPSPLSLCPSIPLSLPPSLLPHSISFLPLPSLPPFLPSLPSLSSLDLLPLPFLQRTLQDLTVTVVQTLFKSTSLLGVLVAFLCSYIFIGCILFGNVRTGEAINYRCVSSCMCVWSCVPIFVAMHV